MNDIFEILWQDYCELNPEARSIHQLLAQDQEHIINDHIALRTVNHAHCDIDHMAQAFLTLGYQFADDVYRFEEKHLRARYLFHEDSSLPLVFISELCLQEMTPALSETLLAVMLSADVDLMSPARPWPCQRVVYESLLAESEYAAWLYAFGWRANHFTVSVNHLQRFENIESLIDCLSAAGYRLNDSGGVVKGSEAQYLKQASTRAALVDMEMDGQSYQVPSCYVEFAQRFHLPNGELFRGFIASSADKIFESTDTKPKKL